MPNRTAYWEGPGFAGLQGSEERVPGGACPQPAADTRRWRGTRRVPWARASGALLSEDSFDGEKWQLCWTATLELGPKVMRAEDGAQIQDTGALV